MGAQRERGKRPLLVGSGGRNPLAVSMGGTRVRGPGRHTPGRGPAANVLAVSKRRTVGLSGESGCRGAKAPASDETAARFAGAVMAHHEMPGPEPRHGPGGMQREARSGPPLPRWRGTTTHILRSTLLAIPKNMNRPSGVPAPHAILSLRRFAMRHDQFVQINPQRHLFE